MITSTGRPNRKPENAARTGSVALMLALVLALLVGTLAISISSRVTHERRNDIQHQSIATLRAAIDAVEQSGMELDEKIRLPLNEASPASEADSDSRSDSRDASPLGDRWIVVERVAETDASPQYQATLYQDDHPGLSIRRPVER
ncbi:hypothetical protein SAMN06265222_10677 [Neorhodopirellula lusitana]|uniref:Type II secretion system protein n=1 Tax=Neorhodopirellula lusitana TaxID=445327 RepID=A0ABY1Q6F6_9BACT|nr:hypothetical protein [Neorhodopirellula lusitana]SMP58612.1 hypothetical protein SAMN06265222_10677 [Neorhodopirellula lusitana]